MITASGTPDEIYRAVNISYPGAIAAIDRADKLAEGSKKQRVIDYQAAWIYGLASHYNQAGRYLLELGAYYGFCTSLIAQAAPLAQIKTCGVLEWECKAAARNLRPFDNVTVLCVPSWDLLSTYEGPELDFIFIDGDHKRVNLDLPWWNWLAPHGLMLFHDYSPNGSSRACPPVYRKVSAFRDWLGRDQDVLIVDDDGVGMIGFYKRAGDAPYRGE